VVCVGHRSCTLECSDYQNLHQHGCNVTSDALPAQSFDLNNTCGAVGKTAVIEIECAGAQACNASATSALPSFVTAVTNAYNRGKEGGFGPPNAAGDRRALASPTAGEARGIGKLAEGVIISVDIAVANPTREYRLAAYFVDWERQGRANHVSIYNSTAGAFDIFAPSQLLRDFGGGAYLVWVFLTWD